MLHFAERIGQAGEHLRTERTGVVRDELTNVHDDVDAVAVGLRKKIDQQLHNGLRILRRVRSTWLWKQHSRVLSAWAQRTH